MKPSSLLLSLAALAAASFFPAGSRAQAGVAATPEGAPVPAHATRRVASLELNVAPDRAGWTYEPGEPVKFRVRLGWDQQPIGGAEIRYRVGPEMTEAEERTAIVPLDGLEIDGGTLADPGFIRCVVTATIDGRTTRSTATAGFAPERIRPTQAEPADFDAFWAASKEALAKIPLEPRLQLVPEASTGSVNVYHVSFQTWAGDNLSAPARVYGMLCEPKAPGKHPALLRVPGAGVRPYTGSRELAERGVITLDIGIHGIPVNLANELYEQLRVGALAGYPTFNLDNRDTYYYRRVYLGCVRANDFLASRDNWDGKTLLVQGGSQGGQLTVVTAALDPRVTGGAAAYPAYCDVTGYLHGRAGGWPHMLRGEKSPHRTEAKIATTAYYDVVNFARRLRAPMHFVWGYNDEVCPPTSMYAAYNVVTAPKELTLALRAGHAMSPEMNEKSMSWIRRQAGVE